MKKHTKIYYNHFDYGFEDFVPCELTGLKAVDIHHIEARGMGGSSEKNDINNLMAVTRNVHLVYGDKKQYMKFLNDAHNHFMETNEPYICFDPHNEAFDELLQYPNFKEIIQWNRRIS